RHANGIDEYRPYRLKDCRYAYKPLRLAGGNCETKKQASNETDRNAKRKRHTNHSGGGTSYYTAACPSGQVPRNCGPRGGLSLVGNHGLSAAVHRSSLTPWVYR